MQSPATTIGEDSPVRDESASPSPRVASDPAGSTTTTHAVDTAAQAQSANAMTNQVQPPTTATGTEPSTQACNMGRDASVREFIKSTGPSTQQSSPAPITAAPARNKHTREIQPVLLLHVGSMHCRDGLLAALSKQGIRAESLDPSDGPQHDITDDTVWDALLKQIRSGKFSALVATPPAQSCSRNRGTGQLAFRGTEGKERNGSPGLQPK